MGKPHENYALDPKPLGIGGQAEVFKATDKRNNRVVALKRILRRLHDDEETINRMRREIEVQTTIHHKNVMPIFDHSEKYQWYVMPLANEVVGKLNPPVDHSTLLQIVEDTANGLSAAHKQGYIHRDLTPNNILRIAEDGVTRWVVSDWGLVRRLGHTTVANTIPGQQFGTAGFAPPEAWIDAHKLDERADVFSLGRVVAWCLTGKWPAPNVALLPEGIWRDFVISTTSLEISNRPNDMGRVLDLLLIIKQPPVVLKPEQNEPEPIRITGIIVEEITKPRNDGTRGSGLYAVPFQLSRQPSSEWAALFIENWKYPPRFTTMHRSSIARVVSDKVILDGTTMEEIEKYHQETLKLVIERVNQLIAEYEKKEQIRLMQEEQRLQKHKDNINDVARRIKFD